MLRSYLKNVWDDQDNSATDNKRDKKERKTKRWEDNIKDWTGMEFGDSVKGCGKQNRVEMFILMLITFYMFRVSHLLALILILKLPFHI